MFNHFWPTGDKRKGFEMTEDTEKTQEATQDTAEKQDTATTQEKTFTQAELDKVIADRLARERAKMPPQDKLKAFEEWQKSQQTEADKQAEREKEYARLQSEAENLKRENLAIKAGVGLDDVDYVIYKVGKMEGDFGENLKSFLDENKKYTEPATKQVAGTQHQPSKSDDAGDRIAAAARKAAGL